jgi:putative alpha-1,2-mannosidase
MLDQRVLEVDHKPVGPFGMLQWSPDTTPGRINAPGGDTYDDSQTRGFSLTHLRPAGEKLDLQDNK